MELDGEMYLPEHVSKQGTKQRATGSQGFRSLTLSRITLLILTFSNIDDNDADNNNNSSSSSSSSSNNNNN